MSMEQAARIETAVARQIQDVIGDIDGNVVVEDLLELASIGGERLEPTDDHPVHIATNRLALTEDDIEARRSFVKPRMYAAGMDVREDHPMAIVGIYPGRHEELEPVVALSHTDTVPMGDIYDGTLGVVGAIKAIEAMHARKIYPERDIMVVSVTGEESSRFGGALMGSRALTHGLADSELDLRKPGDLSIREALGERGVRRAREAWLGPKGHMLATPYALVELHVEQDRKLIDSETDLGVVHSIAAPVRYRARVGGKPLLPDTYPYAHERYFRLTVHGESDHSGATPMGSKHRADGLLEMARLLQGLGQSGDEIRSVGDIQVAEAAMNKIPGETTALLRFASDSENAVNGEVAGLQAVMEFRAARKRDEALSRFPDEPYALEEVAKPETSSFFPASQISQRQRAAFLLIQSVHDAAHKFTGDNVVGTVASHTVSAQGIIELEVDIRGIKLDSRDETVSYMRRLVGKSMKDFAYDEVVHIELGEPLPGSGDAPVELDPRLVDAALDTIQRFEIGNVASMFSAAGHDTQNAARAGIPSVMIFCQSKNGVAHNPNAYTSPENIQKGVQAQAALMLRLANEVPDIF